MNLNEANHTITEVAKMLDALVEQGVIDMQVKRDLVPILVNLTLRHEQIEGIFIEE